MLEDLEPIDCQGQVIEIWRNMVQDAERQGQPLGAIAFQFLAPPCVIGQGSFGIVWRAQDRTNGVKYAVKNMRSQRDEVYSPAQRELDMSNHVRLQPHPCIVAFHQIFSFPSFCMIVMEFCPRGDLLHQIREARREAMSANTTYEPPALAERWIGQIFLALEHLHLKMRSMLRDLKPENVVVSDRGIAKLTDFGFGRGDVESNGTWSFGMPPGSPGYIAPESLLQQQYDYRTDLYSYGVVIWVLLTGGVKYDAEPRPPLGVKKSRSDYMAHANDWSHLQQCIQNPEKEQACSLPAIAVELVTNLTQKRQADRPLHPEIRQYPLLQKLGLPEMCDSRNAVNAWLAASEDGSSSSRARAPASASSS
jgi:serine/threonine protein kinase